MSEKLTKKSVARNYAFLAVMLGSMILGSIVGAFFPQVKEGDEVAANQTLCIVEAMKLMNEIPAEEQCVVREICVENAQPVEFGTVMFYLEPHNAKDAIGPENA